MSIKTDSKAPLVLIPYNIIRYLVKREPSSPTLSHCPEVIEQGQGYIPMTIIDPFTILLQVYEAFHRPAFLFSS